ncbi:c-type cytochrome [Aquiflexum sp. TKW24L]|uniref:PVC-type heme-binding CxxCH protein n=1 Tax=Aquiflexum sp. TKW24L TaxID=2942212 RepID=UPI0020C04CB1|nr:PVC-type heme-binding CxxCH protein [Aquiflexum sp. TKW24L]MCL6259544.1 c-type cytochrome [Aquiflexum sp. TKW24L]
MTFSFKTHDIQFSSFLFLFLIFCYSCSQDSSIQSNLPAGVKVLDDRLKLEVVVEDPEIVTPIGIAIDDKDRVFVLESHTHTPPKDYAGPKGDVIKVFEDSNGDGKLDKMTVFAEGIQEGMNLTFSPEGHLHLITSREVWVFYDKDGDGVSEESKKLMGLSKPESVYPHAALLSITFSPDGWMYIGRGNTGGGHWIFEGSDGSNVSGYGDGGNIIRTKWDGSEVEVFSTGYWNPFDLKFDNYGRLMVADNDPDSRGPNRLVHAVQGSNFGYQSLFGGSGMHPYLAWNGELPGTLPIAVPLGEAPSGLLNANHAALPKDYHDQMLCTIWEESTIVRIRMKEKGLSVIGNSEVIVEGGNEFRPVAFATDSKGNVYFTDWVIREYPNHGRGKIWRLSTKENIGLLQRQEIYKEAISFEWGEKTKKILQSSFEELKNSLQSDDPYEKHVAVMALSQMKKEIEIASKNLDADIRLGALLAAKNSGEKGLEFLAGGFLSDPDPKIRKMALIWIGSAQMTEMKDKLEKVLTLGEVSNTLIETYLETVKLVQPDFVQAYRNQSSPSSKTLIRELPKNFVSDIVRDEKRPKNIRVFALRYLEDLPAFKELLLSFLGKEIESEIRIQTILALQNLPDGSVATKLLEISLDSTNHESIRSEALSVLSRQPLEDWESIIKLLDDREENVRIEAARYLRSKISQPIVREAFEQKINKSASTDAFQQQLILGLEQKIPYRSAINESEKWQNLLSGNGNLERGRRVFYSNTSLCSTCHAMEGFGGDLGPDLSNVGQSKDRNQLVSSILYPSVEMSPEWQGWFIKMADGTHHQGRQIDVGNIDIKLYTQSKGFITVKKQEVEDYGMIRNSLMPEGLEQFLSDQDIRDLIAFLSKN